MNLRDFEDNSCHTPSHSHSLSHFSLSHRNSTGSFNQLDDSKSSSPFQTATRSRSTPSLSELRLEEARQANQPPVAPVINANRNLLIGMGMLSGLDDSSNGVEVRLMAKDRLATAPKALEFEAECQCKKHPHVRSHSSSSSSSCATSWDEPCPPSRISSCPACTFEKDESVPFPPTVSPTAFRSESTMRSGPSAILPDCLYLGGYSDASNLHALLERNIGVVINVTAEVSNYFPRKLVYYKYFFVDLPTQSISHVFDEVSGIIDDYIYTHKKAVLIHCFAGVSRSASFVIAYLMKSLGMTYENAIQFVRERRKIINPNEGFRKQLQEYETKLKNDRQQEKENCPHVQFAANRPPISPKKIHLPVICFAKTEKDEGSKQDKEVADTVSGLVNMLGTAQFFNFPKSGAEQFPRTESPSNAPDESAYAAGVPRLSTTTKRQ